MWDDKKYGFDNQRFPNHNFQPNQFSIYVLIELALIMINLMKNTLRENIIVIS